MVIDGVKTVGKKVFEPVVKLILVELPVKPAQAVTGDQLIAEIARFEKAGVMTKYQLSGRKQEPEYTTPTHDKEGRAIDAVLCTAPERDAERGMFIWVRIGGATGKLFIEQGSEFVPTANPELDRIPERDSRDRPVERVRAGRDGEDYVVKIGVAWGRLNPTTRKFVATHIDDDLYADWSKRRIRLDGYVREDGSEVAGKWYKWGNKPVFMFWDNDTNAKEFAHATAHTGNAEGGRRTNVGALLDGRVPPLTLEL
jgi:hypothetical protein